MSEAIKDYVTPALLDDLDRESMEQASKQPEQQLGFVEEQNPLMLPALVEISLQCPKCGQIMGFRVEEGQEAVAVCDRCRIPMKAMPQVVRTQREISLRQEVHSLRQELHVLQQQIEKLREDAEGHDKPTNKELPGYPPRRRDRALPRGFFGWLTGK